jgi:hypothetical protein
VSWRPFVNLVKATRSSIVLLASSWYFAPDRRQAADQEYLEVKVVHFSRTEELGHEW